MLDLIKPLAFAVNDEQSLRSLWPQFLNNLASRRFSSLTPQRRPGGGGGNSRRSDLDEVASGQRQRYFELDELNRFQIL
jgi:hypothetical protein